ncbi:ABC transporter permease [Sedimentibacter sp. zth1]|uniref:ABC transporter permease n=1 Tax=Sedimentibacter sp. zth1 TaxID=2816908 RepID=UPI001A921398|nr:ABC transporter permease [Sedimentibacter sp. zth1]QSX05701.1 ABC transporter permease [Sedimentibacter sp. zth1]
MDIFTILKANIRYKKGAFKSIIFLMLIISMALTSIISLNDNISSTLEKAFNKIDTGDIVSFISDKNLTDDIKAKVTNSQDVDYVKDIECIAADNATVNNKLSTSAIFLVSGHDSFKYPVFNNKETGFVNNPESLESGEIYVPISYKTLYNCKTGSKITIELADSKMNLTVKGFIQDAFIGAYVMGIKQAFISAEDYIKFSNLYSENITNPNISIIKFHIYNIYQSDNSKLSTGKFKTNINAISGICNNSIYTMSSREAMKYTKIFTDVGSNILYVFIILLLFIVMIIMGHSISTGIEMDYVNLGVLKSQGFTKGKLRSIFVLQYFIAELIGAVWGTIIAIPVTRLLGNIFQPITGILAVSDISLLKSLSAIIGIMVLEILFVFFKTAKISKISPVKAISGGKDSVYFDSWINIPIGKKALSLRLALRQFMSNKRQHLCTVVVVAILVFFMMSMTIVTNSITSKTAIESLGGIISDIDCKSTKNMTMDKADEIEFEINKITPVVNSVYSRNDYYALDNAQYYASVYNKPEAFKSILKGRIPLYDNEIVITEILSDEIEKGIGDTVTVSTKNKEKKYIISGLFQYMNDVGKCFGMTFATAERITQEKIRPGYFYYVIKDKSKIQKVTDMLNEKFSDVLSATVYDIKKDANVKTIQDSLDAITSLIYIISVVIVLVIVTMVCAKTFLKEKIDIGIYKSIGFTDRNIRFHFTLRFIVVSVVGSVFGIILSLLLTSKMINSLFRIIGISSLATEYSLFTILAPTVLICVCFVVFSYFSSRKVKKVSVNELIFE